MSVLKLLAESYINKYKKTKGETYKVTLNHVLSDLLTENCELLISQVFCDLVDKLQIIDYNPRSGATDPINVLQGVLEPLVVRYLDSTNTHTGDCQPTPATLH